MKKGFIGFLFLALSMPFLLNAQVQAPIAVVNDTIDTCGAVTWIDGHTYTTNSSGYVMLKDVSDNDSVLLVMTFIIRQASASEVWDSTCGNYRWALNNKVYTAPGNYNDTIVNAAGCDSVITLHLLLKSPDTTYTDIIQCAPYTWAVDGNTYSDDTIVYAPNPVVGPDSCQGVLALRYQSLIAADTQFVETCQSTYTWPVNNVTYNAGDSVVTFRKANTSGSGCDTIYTLKYTIGMSEYNLPDTSIVVFGSFTWINGDVFAVDSTRLDSTFVQTLPSATSCDTVRNYNVTILPVFTIDSSACARVTGRSYTGFRWPGETGASIKIQLKTTGDTFYICKGIDGKDSCKMMFHYTDLASDTTWLQPVSSCASYTWVANGVTYTASKDTIPCRLTNVLGCDSVVILPRVTIDTLPNVYIGGIYQVKPGNSTTLYAVGAQGLSYRWSTGATTDSITVSPSENTEYSVTATDGNSCTRSSSITVVVSEGIAHASSAAVKVYPNPASTKVVVESENLANVKMYNMLGQLMTSQNAVSGKVVIPVSDFQNGSYILRAETADGKTSVRSVVIKK